MLSVSINGSVTLDESAGLQTGGIAVPGEDNNDSDVLLSTLPATFSTRLFGAGGLGVSSAFGTAVGVGKSADNFITVAAGGTVNSLGFSKADGSALPVYAGVATGGVSAGFSAIAGGAISLFADASLGTRMVIGVDTTNQISLAIFMDPNASLTSAKVWTVQFEPLANPDATNFDDPVSLAGLGVAAGSTLVFSFDQLHSGANLFGCVGDAANSLLVIAEHPKLKADGTLDVAGQTVKTSQGGTGATIGIDSQMIDPGEGAFFTYVKGSDPNFLAAALDQGEADNSAAIKYSGGTNAASGASVTISQTQGPTPGTMTVAAFDVAGSPQQKAFVDGISTGTGIGAAVAITSITIHKADGTTVTEAAGGPNTSANISFANGVATVSGLGSGDTIGWTTSAPHDRVLIKGVAGKFDVGAFSVDLPNSDLAPLSGIRFEDDGPSTTAAPSLLSLLVDESNLATDDTQPVNASSVFTSAFGVDGGAGSTSFTFGFSAVSGDSGLDDTATGLSVFLFNESGNVVGRAGADATAAASGPVVFTVSVDSSGNVKLDQKRAIVHPDATNPDDEKQLTLSGALVVNGTVTDNDGDHVTKTINDDLLLRLKDDGPSITGTIVGAPTLTVDETVLTTDSSGSFAAQFSPVFGNDGPGGTPVSYALSTPGGNSGLVDTATKQAVNLSVVGGVVEGRTATSNELVFTVSVNASGVVTLDQKRAIVHPNTSSNDESVTLLLPQLVVLTATAKDGDNDSASTALNIGQQLVFKDDGPAIGPIANSIVDFISGATVTKTLNGVVGADVNGVPYTIETFTTTITVNGVEVRGVISANKQVVTYFADTNHNTTFGDAGDTAFYRLTLNEAGAGTYTFDVLVAPPPAEVKFDFNDLPSGQNLFGMLGDPSTGLIVFGKTPVLNADGTFTNASNTINTSKGGGGTTIGVNNQMFDSGEGAYFTFVKNPDPNVLGPALDSNEADDADNMTYTGGTLEVDNGFLTIVQTQGNVAGSLTLTAFDLAGSPQGRDLITARGTGTQVKFTQVKVTSLNGQVRNISIAAGGQLAVNVTGLAAGDTVSWKTAVPHDQVFVAATGGKFDIGGFGTTQGAPTPDQKLDFVVKVTDGDGDTSTAGFSVGIDGTGIFDDGIVAGVAVNRPASLFGTAPIDELADLLA